MRAKSSSRTLASAALFAIACGQGQGTAGSSQKDTRPEGSVSWASDESIGLQQIPLSQVVVDTLASGLEVPWAGVILPGGDFLFTERNGRVRLIRNDTLLGNPLIQLEIRPFDDNFKPESGLTGIALAPDYASTGDFFVLAAYEKARGGLPKRLTSKVVGRFKDLFGIPVWEFENRLLRLRLNGDKAVVEDTVLAGLPTNHYHSGGFVLAGPDELLYLSVGDGTYPRVAQKGNVLAGKILRVRPGGSAEGLNLARQPFVFATGLRNSQGMAWHSESGTIFAVDHGPTGMHREKYRDGNDELNVMVSGGNYGWPIEGGSWGGTKHVQPIRVWGESIAPSGLVALPTGDPNRAELVVSSLRPQALRWLTLFRDGATWRVLEERILLEGAYGRLRLLAGGPDGSLYVGTSNRDGRGAPRASDDLVLRITLVNSRVAANF